MDQEYFAKFFDELGAELGDENLFASSELKAKMTAGMNGAERFGAKLARVSLRRPEDGREWSWLIESVEVKSMLGPGEEARRQELLRHASTALEDLAEAYRGPLRILRDTIEELQGGPKAHKLELVNDESRSDLIFTPAAPLEPGATTWLYVMPQRPFRLTGIRIATSIPAPEGTVDTESLVLQSLLVGNNEQLRAPITLRTALQSDAAMPEDLQCEVCMVGEQLRLSVHNPGTNARAVTTRLRAVGYEAW